MLSQSYPIRDICRVLGAPRSSYYHRVQARDETTLKATIERLAGEWPTYGYRRLTALLRREHLPVNHKRVARLMRDLGLQGQSPRRRPRTTNSAQAYPRFRNLVQRVAIVRPDQVWVGTLQYSAPHQDRSPCNGVHCG
jgi:transposase InsO family protein